MEFFLGIGGLIPCAGAWDTSVGGGMLVKLAGSELAGRTTEDVGKTCWKVGGSEVTVCIPGNINLN